MTPTTNYEAIIISKSYPPAVAKARQLLIETLETNYRRGMASLRARSIQPTTSELREKFREISAVNAPIFEELVRIESLHSEFTILIDPYQ